MSAATLRILDETRMDGDEVRELTGWSKITLYRAYKAGLEHLRTGPKRGAKIITSREALERYLARLNGLDSIGAPRGTRAHSKRRQRELDACDAELDAAGI
jgi:hypothetical protein